MADEGDLLGIAACCLLVDGRRRPTRDGQDERPVPRPRLAHEAASAAAARSRLRVLGRVRDLPRRRARILASVLSSDYDPACDARHRPGPLRRHHGPVGRARLPGIDGGRHVGRRDARPRRADVRDPGRPEAPVGEDSPGQATGGDGDRLAQLPDLLGHEPAVSGPVANVAAGVPPRDRPVDPARTGLHAGTGRQGAVSHPVEPPLHPLPQHRRQPRPRREGPTPVQGRRARHRLRGLPRPR